MKIYFFHGKESGPHGSKYQSLATLGEIHSPDFQGMDIWERLEKAVAVTEGEEDLIVVGSSMGGLLAAMLYARHPERFRALVLMAPALHLPEMDDVIDQMPPAEKVVVFHGRQDDVVPLDPVVEFCARFGVPVEVVEDGHRLQRCHELMLRAVADFMKD